MQNGIIVNGILVNIPGVYPRVDTSAMTPAVLGVTGYLGVIAPSDGGLPNTIYKFANYDDAARVLRGGRILSYLARMFQPSTDPDVKGTSNVVFIRANPSIVASTIQVPTANTHPVTVNATDAGAWTNGIRVTVTVAGSPSSLVLATSPSTAYYSAKTVLVEDVPDNQSYSYTIQNGVTVTAPSGSTATFDSANQEVTLATNSTLVEAIPYTQVPTFADLVNWINNHTGWMAQVVGPSYLPTSAINDNTAGPATVASTAIFFPAESGALAYFLQTQCPVVTAIMPTFPDVLSALAQTYMTGGAGKGSDTIDTDQVTAALSLAATTRMDLVWMQTTETTCQELLLQHCAAMSTDVARKYRIGICGLNFDNTSPYDGAISGASSNDNAIALSAAITQTMAGPLTFCVNGSQYANPVTGVQEQLGGLGLAAQVAGMKSGTKVGMPLTNKTITSAGLEFPNWTDAQKTLMLNSGILTAFYDPDEGTTKILQAITTEQSTNPMLRNLGGLYIVHELARQEIRALATYVGYPLDLSTGNLIKVAIAKMLDGLKVSGSNPDGFLTEGQLPDGTKTPAWEGLQIQGDSTTGAWSIRVSPHPVGETDFITILNKLTPAPINL